MIGKTIDVVVTSVLQTTAGKMIFGRFIEPGSARRRRAPSPTAQVDRRDAPTVPPTQTAAGREQSAARVTRQT